MLCDGLLISIVVDSVQVPLSTESTLIPKSSSYSILVENSNSVSVKLIIKLDGASLSNCQIIHSRHQCNILNDQLANSAVVEIQYQLALDSSVLREGFINTDVCNYYPPMYSNILLSPCEHTWNTNGPLIGYISPKFNYDQSLHLNQSEWDSVRMFTIKLVSE